MMILATKRHCVRSNRQNLSTVRAYYPVILVSIFATLNFVTECLFKVRILWRYPGIISSDNYGLENGVLLSG